MPAHGDGSTGGAQLHGVCGDCDGDAIFFSDKVPGTLILKEHACARAILPSLLKWALVSRDIRWVLVAGVLALSEVPAANWQALWRLIAGG